MTYGFTELEDNLMGVWDSTQTINHYMPPQSFFIRLSRFIYLSEFSPAIILAILLAIAFFGGKMKKIAAFAAICVSAVPYLHWYTTGSITMMYLAIAFTMTAVIFILRFIKLSYLDYAVLFSAFVYMVRFVGIDTNYYGIAMPSLYVFVIIFGVYKIRLGQLKSNLFFAWFTCILVFIKAYALSFILWRGGVVGLSQEIRSPQKAFMVWVVVLFVIICVSAVIIFLIKRLCKNHFYNINKMGRAYPQTERFFIYNSLGITAAMSLLHYVYGIRHGFLSSALDMFDLFLLLAMVLQLSFLIMFFRITRLKDENKNLAVYSSGLEKNIDNIKYIKHDIKNIFLTMGNFVEQSGDTKLQAFYREKISPFAVNQIAQNDLFAKLAAIDDEQLKAFMFYKISQAFERGIHVDLDIPQQSQTTPMDFIDLVRVLGILLDNAIEECVLNGGRLHIKISQNNEMISYTIKNTVRPKVKEKGIRPGVSEKGTNRGKGLLGIRNIIQRYDFVTLNSYFQEDLFVQSLVIFL